MTGLHQMMVLTSDFATSSYGESWDSSCEKSWVSVQNHWVPVKKKEFEIENIWDFMQPDSLSEDRLQNSILQLYIEIKI